MQRINENVVNFLHTQNYVIVSTVDKKGFPHSSCKGIVKIDPKEGLIYLLDVYRANTHENLMRSPYLSITAIDEHKFSGYCLKGKARIFFGKDLDADFLKSWDERVASRVTQRLLRNIREEKGHSRHPEALLPKPEYLIAMEVEEIVDLTPHHLK